MCVRGTRIGDGERACLPRVCVLRDCQLLVGCVRFIGTQRQPHAIALSGRACNDCLGGERGSSVLRDGRTLIRQVRKVVYARRRCTGRLRLLGNMQRVGGTPQLIGRELDDLRIGLRRSDGFA